MTCFLREDPERRPRCLQEAIGPGPWLICAPHDDDAVLGMGLTMALAAEAGLEVHVLVVTDGQMGWWQAEEAAGLVAKRAGELRDCLRMLGVAPERQHYLGLPDGSLHLHRGCRKDRQGRPVGFGVSLCQVLRKIAPARVFCCSPTDLHPDHRALSSELDIACFWASGRIWEELGTPVPLPQRLDYAVYCPFRGLPDIQVRGTQRAHEQRIAALRAFASQGTIDDMVARISAVGPVEYLQRVPWNMYQPAAYASLFAECR